VLLLSIGQIAKNPSDRLPDHGSTFGKRHFTLKGNGRPVDTAPFAVGSSITQLDGGFQGSDTSFLLNFRVS